MNVDPLDPVGILTHTVSGRDEMLGTCFLFRYEDIALTAAHCIPDDVEVRIMLPRLDRSQTVVSIARHPNADIAVLRTEPVPGSSRSKYSGSAFWDFIHLLSLGDEFSAYGFPVEGPWQQNEPVPRVFTGHYQRFFDYSAPTGRYQYLAGEMSIPAPEGLSGGPLFHPSSPMHVTAMVTANNETYTVVDYREVDDENKVRGEDRRVISYGIALMLRGVEGWLNEEAPFYE